MDADSIHRDFVKLRYCQRIEDLRSVTAISRFLDQLVEELDMTLLSQVVVPVYGDEPHLEDEGGITGVAVISESHIAIHTWPENAAANIDVYSCKQYDQGDLRTFCEEFFGGRRVTP